MSKNEKKLSILKDTTNRKAEKHRKRQNNLMAGTVIILAITIVSFVLVPALSGSGGGSGTLVFGKYGKTPITFVQGNYFSQQVESINNMYRDSLGADSNVEFLRQLIWRSAFSKTVVRTAILDEIANAGAGVSSQKIDRTIVTSGIFDVNGEFNEAAYMNTTSSRLKEIRDSMKEDLKVQLYYEDTVYNMQRSDKELDFLLSMGSPEKNFSYAIYPYSAYPAAKVSEYGKENAKIFRKMNLNRITVTTSEKDALDILNKLDSGNSFEEVAGNMSQDSFAENGGSMGEKYYYDLLTYLNEDQADEIFALRSDAISGIISTDSSYYIFQAAGDPTEINPEKSEDIAVIRTYMEGEEVGMIEDYLMGQAQALAITSQSSKLAAVAAEQGIETGETGFIAPVYGNVPFIANSPGNKTGNNLLSSIAYSDDFFEKAFSLKNPGEVSEPVILEKRIVLFSLEGEQEGTQYPEEYMDYFKSQLSNELTQYNENQIQSVFLKSEKLKDNFNNTFSRVFSQS